jgi:hypothetical protein
MNDKDTDVIKQTFFNSLKELDNEIYDFSLSDFNYETLRTFEEIAQNLCRKIESYIYSNPKLRELIKEEASIESISFSEDGLTFHMTSGGCCRNSWRPTRFDKYFPLSWFTDETWKEEAKKKETARKAKETKERRAKERKAEEARIAKEEKDKSEYERLKKKFKK